MTREAILFVEDDAAGRELGLFNLRKAGYDVDAAASGDEALAAFSPDRHALVITDVKMPGISGLELLRAVKERAPGVPVIVITAYGSVDLAVEAMRAGAFDFIGKPFNRDHLLLVVERAVRSLALESELRSLRIRAAGVERPIVFCSARMKAVLDLCDKVAASDASVLVTGESGTGKELVARRIHARSPRAEGPFAAVNCAAMPAELLESELFGHEKGAFTGAVRARPGRFRQAAGGTVFLDEVSEIPLALQAKLLRALQERMVDVVGADAPRPIDVRVIAATNADLRALARSGRFREDLLYRLDVVEVAVPALRERKEDIEPLVRHFVAAFAEGRDPGVPADLVAAMKEREWPGNVRELENACLRLVVLCAGDELSVRDLPPAAAAGAEEWPPLPPGGLSLVDLERRVIERALALKSWNVSQTAAYLGVPRHILSYRMEKHGIRRPG
jgi:DNA-binding NtrC family response regulator